ncbi:hypothetical protein niasHT_029405 [Heterodera trifolii]|uniref:RING-type domain-containing protein n=1 Tax=Heterodera trifolii TaxID=157864 RepID=A0ABD2KRN0_9BILA
MPKIVLACTIQIALFFVCTQEIGAPNPSRLNSNEDKLLVDGMHKIFEKDSSNDEQQNSDKYVSANDDDDDNDDDQHRPPIECTICDDCFTNDQLCFCDVAAGHANGSSSSSSSAAACGQAREKHAFCIECLHEYTKAAHEMVPFEPSGLGLKCMALDCKNPITWKNIKELLPKEQHRSIETLKNHCDFMRMAIAGNGCMKYCPCCNYAIDEMDISVDKRRPFKCPKCGKDLCRKCNVPWNDKHKKATFCEIQNKDLHVCDKCSLIFIKDEGCNYVNCPCGGTHCYCCGMSEIFGTNHFCGCGEEKRIICEDKCQLCGKCTLYGNVKDLSSSTNKDIPSTSTKGRKGKEKAAEMISDDLAQKLKEMRLKKEESLSEVTMHQCECRNDYFIKAEGPTFVNCPACEKIYCFCCRKSKVSSFKDHFCGCKRKVKPSLDNPCKCLKCKKCIEYSDYNKFVQIKLDKIQKDYKQKEEKLIRNHTIQQKIFKIFDRKQKNLP